MYRYCFIVRGLLFGILYLVFSSDLALWDEPGDYAPGICCELESIAADG